MNCLIHIPCMYGINKCVKVWKKCVKVWKEVRGIEFLASSLSKRGRRMWKRANRVMLQPKKLTLVPRDPFNTHLRPRLKRQPHQSSGGLSPLQTHTLTALVPPHFTHGCISLKDFPWDLPTISPDYLLHKTLILIFVASLK